MDGQRVGEGAFNISKPGMGKSDIEQWKDAIDLGYQYKKKYGECDRWETYKKYYRGIFPGYTTSTTGILPYNLTYAMARTLIPNIYFRNPYVNITPRPKFGARIPLDMHAKILEGVDNWLCQEMSLKKEMKTALLDGFFTNKCIWKIGYDSQYGFTPTDTADNIGIKDATLTQFSKKGELTEYNINVKPGMPWVLRVDPDDIIVPFGTRVLDDCAWIAQRVIRPLSDVKGDPKYKHTKDLEGTHLEMIYKDSKRVDFYKEMTKLCDWVEIWEIRDRKRKEICAFVPGYDEWIREPEEDVLQIEGLPYVDMNMNEDPQYFWGVSDVAIMEPQQLKCNEARTQAMLHRRAALLKFLVDKNIIDQEEIDKMCSENVAPVVRLKGPPGASIVQLQPHIPADLIGWVEQIRSDVREMIGFSRQSSGELPAGRRTAREVDVATMAKEIRLDERRDMMADCFVDIIRKVNQVIFDKWDTSHIVQVVGYDGAKYWIEYTRDAIMGEYNVRVDVESMTPVTKALKRKEIVELVGALSKYPRANIDYLMKVLVREFDYLDALAILPEAPETAGGQPMPASQFVQQQQAMASNPQVLQARVRQTQKAMGG